MADPAQNLNVVIGGILDPSLVRVFQRLQNLVGGLEQKLRRSTGAMDLNTRSQERGTAAASSNASATSRATLAADRMAKARQKQAEATRKAYLEEQKMATLMERSRSLMDRAKTGTKNYLNSDKWQEHKERAGLGMMAAGTGIAFAAKGGADLEDKIIQSLITDGKGISALDPTRLALHGLANKGTTGQTMDSLAEGLGIYTSAGMSLEEGLARLKFSGKVTTATGSNMGEITQTELAMKSMFHIVGATAEETAQKTARAWGILATAGNEGSFELKNMAQHMTTVGSSAGKLGLTGEKDLAYVAAGLQAQVKEAPDPSTAANNMYNIMEKLTGDATLAEKLQGKGINVASLKKKGFENSAAGRDGNALELIVEAIGKKYDKTSEDKRGAFLGEMIQDMQARTGLLALLKHRDFIKETKGKSLEGADSGIIDKQYATAMESSAKSWESIMGSMGKFGQAATIAFAPSLKFLSSALETASRLSLEFTANHKGVAGMVYPALMGAGAFMALGMKVRMLGAIFRFAGLARVGAMLGRFPKLTTVLGSSFRWLWGAMRGLPGGVITRLQNLRFMLGSLHVALRAGLRGAMARFAPFAARGGLIILRGLSFVLTRGVAALAGTVGAVLLAAIGGWKIGQWLDAQFNISDKITGWWNEITGLNARMEAMKNGSSTRDMDAGRLSALDGDAGQQARQSAIAKWESRKQANNAKLAEKKGEWWTSSGDKQEIAGLNMDNRLADSSIANIRGQMARQANGKAAFGDDANAIAAAKAKLTMYEDIIKRGGSEDVSLSEAKTYADGLRSQLSGAKAKGTTLTGAANSSAHTTTLHVNVSGADANGAGQAVSSAVEQKLKERDREVARSYRGVASTGSLGD